MVIEAQPPGDVRGALASQDDVLVFTADGELYVAAAEDRLLDEAEYRRVFNSSSAVLLNGRYILNPEPEIPRMFKRGVAGQLVTDEKLAELTSLLRELQPL